jgi:tetratricopeptide (TPR) repeat protein/tRNA A-37 threonylcarbamoyl transferase component Bud32
MGAVYRARQIKADRIVALKLPYADANPELRVRFRTEAKAVARFQHPNIVQVFEVGETDHAPFMALEFCPGGSLADRLDGTPLPPRDAAEVTEIVARAVAAAHAAGIIHRDLKPSNILLGAAEDAGASELRVATLFPKVSDFGLARQIDLEDGQTRTGVAIGTPSYMAPEQAHGNSKLVDTRADVYALGAVLYELLTGRPPFIGTTVLETLDQVCKQEPVAPSRVQPRIPRDLETITLKCLRKEPEKRYPTANSLVEDLNRFLTGRPVQARPIGWLERLLKKSRRNPLAAGLLLLLAVAVGSGVGFGVWKQVRMAAERDRARAHFQMSMRAIEELLTDVAEQDLAAEPRAEKTRQALLEKALRFYQDLLAVEVGDPGVEWEAARAARRVGDIDRLLGRYSAALEAYDQATARIGRLRVGGRDDAELQREDALVDNWRGEVFRLQDKLEQADEEYQRATAIQTQLLAAHPDHSGYAFDLAQSLYNRGIVAGTRSRYREAEGNFRDAARALDRTDNAPPEYRQHNARIAINLSDVLRKEGRARDAAIAAEDAIAPLDTLIAAYADRLDYRLERAAAGINLAIARSAAGDTAGAVLAGTDAHQRLTSLVGDFPNTALFRVNLARVCTTLAELEYARNKSAAETSTREAVGQWKTLLAAKATGPSVPSYHGELGIALGNLGRLTKNRPDEARGHLAQGIAEVLIALRANSEDKDFTQSLRQQSRDLVDILVRSGDDAEVVRQAERIRDGIPGSIGIRRAVCFLARAAEIAEKLPGPNSATTRRTESFARRAIALIRAGDTAELTSLADDPECAAFRQRPDFREALVRSDK